MATDRLVLISDVHVDYWEQDLPDNHAAKRQRFLEFFDWLVEGSGARRLVINGDLVDLPQKDGKPSLPRYSDVVAKLREVLDAGIEVAYVVGNHDSGLVGLDVALDEPPIRIDYPYIRVASGGKTFLVEHGHLHDPWLWDYVRTLGSAMLARHPREPGVVFLTQPVEGDADLPKPEEFSAKLPQMWQMHRDEIGPDTPGIEALVEAVERDLEEDYAAVTDPDEDAAMLERRERLRDTLAAATTVPFGTRPLGTMSLAGRPWHLDKQLVEQLVQHLYSGPHWRKAARQRARQVGEKLDKPIHGVIMGHTHYPDERRLKVGGRRCQYVNSGSWRRESADILVIEAGQLTLHARDWRDDWPDPPS